LLLFGLASWASGPLYVTIMTHVEGDVVLPPGDAACDESLYQTLALPPSGQASPPSYSLDVAGTELLRQILGSYADSTGAEPKLFIEPVGEFWQTEADPAYGGKSFAAYDYLSLGYEFGIQGHAIRYSGSGFCWPATPHTEQGVRDKFADMDRFADLVTHGGQAVNGGATYTGGWKLEKAALGEARAEWVIDHEAHALGYRISFEDHDGHRQDEPPALKNAAPSPYLYRADYSDGVRIVKVDFNGSLTVACEGGTPRCETPEEAIARLDRTAAAMLGDRDPRHVFFFAFTVHSNAVWNDFSLASGGAPLGGEGAGLVAFLEALQSRVASGLDVRFVTPSELAGIFEEANPEPAALPYEDSSFGLHPALVPPMSFAEGQNIGVRWHRPPVYCFWALVQPDLGVPAYDWTLTDEQYGAVPEGMNILANVTVEPDRADMGYYVPGSYLPVDGPAYQAFVKAAAERYDGDGVEDMPGLKVPVRYWQVDNEPIATGPRKDFAQLQELTYQAIKASCPECRVLIGGATGFPDGYVENFRQNFLPILEALEGCYVDVFDLHWYGNAAGDYRLLGPALEAVRSDMRSVGFGDIPVWITEMGTYSGDPAELPFASCPPQTEEQQAADLVKRYVYPRSLGVKKVFHAFGLMEGFKGDDGYFDHTGLIYDGAGPDDLGLGVKKAGYFTFGLMTRKLEGAAFAGEIAGLPDHVYGYELSREDGSVLTVLWYDGFAGAGPQQHVTLPVQAPSVLVTQAVAGRDGTVTSSEIQAEEGAVEVVLAESPVYVEACALACTAEAAPSTGGAPLDVAFTATGDLGGCEGELSFAWSFGDGATGQGASLSHTYVSPGTYAWSLTAVAGPHACTQTGTVAVLTSPPAVTAMKKLGQPFRINVEGAGFQDGVRVRINGADWPGVRWKSTSRLVLEGGAALKAAVPKGVSTRFEFVNPDGQSASVEWSRG
jgi:hypothetical protein